MRDTWAEDLAWAPKRARCRRRPLTVLTGELAARAWRAGIHSPPWPPPARRRSRSWGTNRFYGNTVTVAGLLAGSDLRRALLDLPADPRRTVVLSPRVFNSDGLTLDGMRLEDISQDQPHIVVLGEEDGFIDFWRELG